MIKKTAAIFTAFAAFILGGCTTVTTSFGRPFETAKVTEIKKGATTVGQVVGWFGQPITKSVFGADAEVWVYHDASIDTHMRDYGVARDVKQSTMVKRLELFVRNGIVENYTYTEGPM